MKIKFQCILNGFLQKWVIIEEIKEFYAKFDFKPFKIKEL